jgi:hypothetical protein
MSRRGPFRRGVGLRAGRVRDSSDSFSRYLGAYGARGRAETLAAPALVLVGLTPNPQLLPWGPEAAQEPQGTALRRCVDQRAAHH